MAFLPPDPVRPNHRLLVVAAPVLTMVLVVGSAGAAVALTGNHDTTQVASATSTATAAATPTSTPTAAVTGTLSASSTSVVQGATITFSYATAASSVNSENWVGL